jgi:hypothetical protein
MVVVVVGAYIGCALYGYSLWYARRNSRDDPLSHWTCHSVFGALIALNTMFVYVSSLCGVVLCCVHRTPTHSLHSLAHYSVCSAFPFAPTRCVLDWWRGYLLSELKMQVEGIAMFVVAVGVIWGDAQRSSTDQASVASYWIVIAFAAAMVVADAVTLVCSKPFLSHCSSFFNVSILCVVWCVVQVFLHHSVERRLRRRRSYSTNAIVDLFNSVCAHLQHVITHRIRAPQPRMPDPLLAASLQATLTPQPAAAAVGAAPSSAVSMARPDHSPPPLQSLNSNQPIAIATTPAPPPVPLVPPLVLHPYTTPKGGTAQGSRLSGRRLTSAAEISPPHFMMNQPQPRSPPPARQSVEIAPGDVIQPPQQPASAAAGSHEPDPGVNQPLS